MENFTISLAEESDPSVGVINTSAITVTVKGPLADVIREDCTTMQGFIDELMDVMNDYVETRLQLVTAEDSYHAPTP